MATNEERLSQVMDRVYRFSHNQSTHSILVAVYGEDQAESYMEEKERQIKTRGFGSWFCDLDLENRRVVARMVIDRYPELREIIG